MSKKAFTLIELLIAITIIGVLAAAITVGYTRNIKQSKCTRVVQDFDAISKAAMAYRETNDLWPDEVGAGVSPSFVTDGYLKTWPNADYYHSGYLFDYERMPVQPTEPAIIAVRLVSVGAASAVEYYCIQDLRNTRPGSDCMDPDGDGSNNENLPTPLNRGGTCAL